MCGKGSERFACEWMVRLDSEVQRQVANVTEPLTVHKDVQLADRLVVLYRVDIVARSGSAKCYTVSTTP